MQHLLHLCDDGLPALTADDTNLSASRTLDGDPVIAPSIPAFDSPDIRRSDSIGQLANPAALAPTARTSRRGFIMNSFVSAAAIASATAIPNVGFPASADPVFAVIERHKALSAAYDVAVNHPDVGDNSPEFAELNAISNLAGGKMIEHADVLFAFRPTSSTGVGALLRYISTLEDWQMPRGLAEPSEIEALKNLCGSLSIALAMSSGVQAIGEAARVSSAIGGSSVDPIFAAIEAHQEAAAAYSRCLVHRGELEEVLPADKRRSFARRDGIAKTDDPRFIEASEAVSGARDKMLDLAVALIDTPTTVAGVASLLKYVSETHVDDNDWMFPEYVSGGDDDEEGDLGEAYQLAVMRGASEAIQRMTWGAAA
jgi:hypothetical protein